MVFSRYIWTIVALVAVIVVTSVFLGIYLQKPEFPVTRSLLIALLASLARNEWIQQKAAREIGLTLFPDRIEIHRLDARAEVNLADDFRVVRLEMVGDDAVVKVDGEPVLDLDYAEDLDCDVDLNLVFTEIITSKCYHIIFRII